VYYLIENYASVNRQFDALMRSRNES